MEGRLSVDPKVDELEIGDGEGQSRRRFAEHRIDIADYHPLELQAMPGFR